MCSIIKSVCILLFSFHTIFADSSAEYPSDLPKCHLGDNKCITEVVQYILTNHSNGIDSINLRSLDPLHIDKYELIRDAPSDVENNNVTLIMEHINWKNRNLDLYGFKNATFTITGFEKNLNDSNVIITLLMPNLTATGDHKLKFKFLQKLTHGEGKFRYEFDNMNFRLEFAPIVYKKNYADDKQYMKIDQLNVDYNMTAIPHINLGTIFDGDNVLSESHHKYLKNKRYLLFHVIKSEAGPALAKVFKDIINPVFDKFSIDQLFI